MNVQVAGLILMAVIVPVPVAGRCQDLAEGCKCDFGSRWRSVSDNCQNGCMYKIEGHNATFEQALADCANLGVAGSKLLKWESTECYQDVEEWLICTEDDSKSKRWWTAGGSHIPDAERPAENVGNEPASDIDYDSVLVHLQGSGIDRMLTYSTESPELQKGYICMADCDDCADDPCQNGGTCIDGIRSYTCECPPEYTGPNCEEDVTDPCSPNPCINGGVCHESTVAQYTCSCHSPFSGDNCEIPIWPTCVIRKTGSHYWRWDQYEDGYSPEISCYIMLSNAEGDYYMLEFGPLALECDNDPIQVTDLNTNTVVDIPFDECLPDSGACSPHKNDALYTFGADTLLVPSDNILITFGPTSDICEGQVVLTVIAISPPPA